MVSLLYAFFNITMTRLTPEEMAEEKKADLRPWSLFAKGRHMLHEGRVLCKGTFEE